MSKLEEISKEYRENNVNRNLYNAKNEYNQSNPRAISDGDENGKDNNGSGSIGGSTDIKTRDLLLNKNPYFKKEYNASNNG